MAWGSSSLRSCSSLWEKIERNDPSLADLYVLPTKRVTKADWERCIRALQRHGQNRHLRSIHASGHAIDVESLQQFSQAVYTTSREVSWTEIAVGDSRLGDVGVVALVSSFERDCQLESLDLSYKNLSTKGLNSVLEWVGTSESLKRLDLSRNVDLAKGLVPDDLRAPEANKPFPTLEDVNLSDCNLQGSSGELLVSLFASAPRLRLLRLSQNPLGSSTVESLARISPFIVDLAMSNCHLADEHLEKIVPSLSELEHLESLDISQNALTESGAVALTRGMASGLPVIKSINLAGNPLRGNGVASFIEQIRKLDRAPLFSLDLSSTQCTAEAARLAIELSGAHHLRLFDNALGSDGFRLLSDVLRGGHATINTLDLAGNGADEQAVLAVLQGLLDDGAGFVSVLKTLVLGGNQGGSDLEELIQQVKKVRPGLDIARDRLRKT